MSVAGSLDLWDSRRLWSLWDMLLLNARAFYEVTTQLQHFRTAITAGIIGATVCNW